MQFFDQAQLDAYMATDVIGGLLDFETRPNDPEHFGCHRWLRDSAPKRMVFQSLYGDLLNSTGRRVLDVGGGFTAISRVLNRNHDYRVLDLMAHDSKEALVAETEEAGAFWVAGDWASYEPSEPLDLVIANDIFPNVDQRLEQFLDRYLPHCRELRLLLTYYESPRSYKVQRIDAEEIFHMMAWDGHQTQRALTPFADRISQVDLDALVQPRPSLYPNGRTICALALRGDVAQN